MTWGKWGGEAGVWNNLLPVCGLFCLRLAVVETDLGYKYYHALTAGATQALTLTDTFLAGKEDESGRNPGFIRNAIICHLRSIFCSFPSLEPIAYVLARIMLILANLRLWWKHFKLGGPVRPVLADSPTNSLVPWINPDCVPARH